MHTVGLHPLSRSLLSTARGLELEVGANDAQK